jgi:hypothetical protein
MIALMSMIALAAAASLRKKDTPRTVHREGTPLKWRGRYSDL